MYVGGPREFQEDSQNLLRRPPTSVRQPIKASKMGKNLTKKSVPQGGSREF